MRLLGMILALAAIGWVLYTASGGDDATGVIPAGYQDALEKAQTVEETVNESVKIKIPALEERAID